jgi:cardiolipin synthase
VSVANLVTLARLLSVPLAIWLILDGYFTAVFWLFVAAGVSDMVDGTIAKVLNQRSELGALLDPIADKVLLVSMFIALGLAGWLPSWLVILVVSRDVLIVGGYLLAMALSQPIRSRPLVISKLNTGLQIMLIAVVLARLGLEIADYSVSRALIYAVAVTTVLSGAGYVVRWWRGFDGPEPTS